MHSEIWWLPNLHKNKFSFDRRSFSFKAMIRYLLQNRNGWAKSTTVVHSQSSSQQIHLGNVVCNIPNRRVFGYHESMARHAFDD